MRTFKQKVLSLITAVCMIATTAAPVFASTGAASGDITLTRGTSSNMTITLDSGNVPVVDSGVAVASGTSSTVTISTTAENQELETVTISTESNGGDIKNQFSPVGNDGKSWKSNSAITFNQDATIVAKTKIKSGGGETTTPSITTVTIKKGAAALTGAPVVGDELTADVVGTDLTGKTLTYQWYRGNTPILNATNKTYTAATEDVGETLKVTVEITGVADSSKSSDATAAVEANGTPDPAPGDFVAVTDVTGVIAKAEVNKEYALSGTVTPSNATNKTIEWSVKDAGTTKATIAADGKTFKATAAGTATVTATIKNGAAADKDYTKDFTIEVTTDKVEDTEIPSVEMTVGEMISGQAVENFAIDVTPDTVSKGDVTWTPNDLVFKVNTPYTANVTLKANAGYKFTDKTTATVSGNHKAVKPKLNADGTLTCTIEFNPVPAQNFTVTFVNGATVVDTKTIVEGSKVTAPQNPTDPEGRTFLGWYTESGVKFDFDKTYIHGDITLTAKWLAKEAVLEPEEKNELENAMKNPESAENKKVVVDTVDQLAKAVGDDPIALKEAIEANKLDVKELDKAYEKATGLKVEGTSNVSTVPSNGVKVAGGALNAAVGNAKKVSIELKNAAVDQTTAKAIAVDVLKTDAKNISKIVPIDISLLVDNTPKKASVSPITITIDLSQSGLNFKKVIRLIHVIEGTDPQGMDVTIDSTAKTAKFTTSNFSDFILANLDEDVPVDNGNTSDPTFDPNRGNGGSSGGSGGGGGGGGKGSGNAKAQSIFTQQTNTINGILKNYLTGGKTGIAATGTATVSNGTPVTEALATKTVNSAISQAKAQQSDSVNAIFRNATTISNSVLTSIANQAQKSGLKVYVTADTMKNGVVDVRLSVLASAASRTGATLSLNAQTGSTSVEQHFAKYFANRVSVIAMGQKGSFGVPVSVSARANLAGMNTQTLRFYTYDASTNAYHELAQDNYFVDVNGYVHFTTDTGNYIIITDQPLTLQ